MRMCQENTADVTTVTGRNYGNCEIFNHQINLLL